ncbi:hypothetical protein GN956_G2338 [Arapaima gigas]
MFSSSPDTGLFHHNNGLAVPTEAACTGPSGQTIADALQLGARKETCLKFRVVPGKDRTGVHPVLGQSPERKLLFTGPWPPPASHNTLGESTSAKWNHIPEAGQRRSTLGSTCYRTCDCAGLRHQTASHPFLRKYMLPPAAPHRGQEHRREPAYVPEKQFWGYPREKYERAAYGSALEHSTKHFNSYHNLNSNFCHGQESYHMPKDPSRSKSHPEKVCKGPKSCQGVICSSKGSQSHRDSSSHQILCLSGDHIACVPSKVVSEGQSPQKGPRLDERKTMRPSVRDQIRLVVADLEDVLGGLKQIHLEMKEVVQQIELLTSNIDLGEEEPTDGFPSNTICSSSSSGVVVSCQKKAINHGLKTDPFTSSLQNGTAYPKPPVLNPSVTVTDEAGHLAPRHMSSIPLAEHLHPTSPPRDRNLETQCEGGHLGPALSRTASQARNQTVIHRPSGPETATPRPQPYHHGVQAGTNGTVDTPVRTPQGVGKSRLLSTTV